MKLLLDTHIVLAGVNREMGGLYPYVDRLLEDGDVESFVSIVSIWEIAIKPRIGKLKTQIPLTDIPSYLATTHFTILPISIPHVIAIAERERPTRDPFDRLLLTQCQVEGLRLVTIDRARVNHPMAYSV